MLFSNGRYIFTSESVSEGHPDKICDQISDALLDEYLKNDPYAKVAIETAATTNRVILLGEVNTPKGLSLEQCEAIVRKVVKNIGYEQQGFHWETLEVHNYIHKQSTEIADGVGQNGEGAGDQGLMFGYACRETPELMPAALQFSHQIMKELTRARKEGRASGLRPDAKSQVSLRYENGQPVEIDTLVVGTQHHPDLTRQEIEDLVHASLRTALPAKFLTANTKYIINSSGSFIVGGPDGDAGLTGRKIIVDSYGGAAPHGGGAFSGKDPTKVDRSAAYMARYLAKNIVASGLADKCIIELSYALGWRQPLSVYVNTDGTGQVKDEDLAEYLKSTFDLSPKGMREIMDLNRPIYLPTAAYGHFGREPTEAGCFSWERTDLVNFFTSVTPAMAQNDQDLTYENSERSYA
jgi:S-adenosylmethionine synthetase